MSEVECVNSILSDTYELLIEGYVLACGIGEIRHKDIRKRWVVIRKESYLQSVDRALN